MVEFFLALLLWLSVFVPSSMLASITAKRNPQRAGSVMQVSMLLISTAAIWLMGGPGKFGLFQGWSFVFPAFLLGFGVSLVLNLSQRDAGVPEFLPEGIGRFALLLLLAPLGEEVFNRGLVEGYLLSHGHLWSAILFSAFLFALPHWMAVEGSKGERAYTVLGAFVIGSLAGYFFALGGLVPAFILHSSANFAGLTVLKLRKTPRYK
ncbi:CPBP family intramembrane glutamic endopeptidase [Thermococcus nautili]|uniref:Zinc-dependent protease, putative n=1 Tax=Thermococcus nautili TaxID=195522 RepID=W8P5Y3_9EURY|nr:CPBP family intramembrane glutamic endopeptidase [Thermococcus nautili]AHL22930.1 zinc-dependent protease, putative [Thermococcus nautili]